MSEQPTLTPQPWTQSQPRGVTSYRWPTRTFRNPPRRPASGSWRSWARDASDRSTPVNWFPVTKEAPCGVPSTSGVCTSTRPLKLRTGSVRRGHCSLNSYIRMSCGCSDLARIRHLCVCLTFALSTCMLSSAVHCRSNLCVLVLRPQDGVQCTSCRSHSFWKINFDLNKLYVCVKVYLLQNTEHEVHWTLSWGVYKTL